MTHPTTERDVKMVEYPMRLVSESNRSRHEHWGARAKRSKMQKTAAYIELSQHVPPALPCRITVTRIAPRQFDGHDNLRHACKFTVDEIAKWLGVDDRDSRVEWRYRQEKGAPKEHRVRIEWEQA